MNTRLFGLGFSILLISTALLTYSLAYSNTSLTGISASMIILGLTILYSSFTITENLFNTLQEYVKLTTNCLTNIIEEADLLDGKISVLKTSNDYYIVISKSHAPIQPYPGLSVQMGQPVLTIPSTNILENASIGTDQQTDLESEISEVLVNELGLCERVRVSVDGSIIRLVMENTPDLIKDQAKYPINMVNIIPSLVTAKIVKNSVKLLRQSISSDSIELVYQVGG